MGNDNIVGTYMLSCDVFDGRRLYVKNIQQKKHSFKGCLFFIQIKYIDIAYRHCAKK